LRLYSKRAITDELGYGCVACKPN